MKDFCVNITTSFTEYTRVHDLNQKMTWFFNRLVVIRLLIGMTNHWIRMFV